MRIGELATATSTQVETIRFYEQEGLLAKPARSEGNFRIYGDQHLQRLTFIRHCRSLDMTLSEIRQLLRLKDLPDENCDAVNELLDAHIEGVSNHSIDEYRNGNYGRQHKEEPADSRGSLFALNLCHLFKTFQKLIA